MEKAKTKPVNLSTDYDVLYHSKLLNKNFNSVDEMKKEEEAYKVEHAKELQLREERAKDAADVKALFDNYMATLKSCQEKVDEANKLYRTARKDFYNKYGFFHETVTYKSDDTDLWQGFSNFIFDIFNKPFNF